MRVEQARERPGVLAVDEDADPLGLARRRVPRLQQLANVPLAAARFAVYEQVVEAYLGASANMRLAEASSAPDRIDASMLDAFAPNCSGLGLRIAEVLMGVGGAVLQIPTG